MIRKIFLMVVSVLLALATQTHAQITEQQRVDQATGQITSLLNSGRPDSSKVVVGDVVDVDSMTADTGTYFGQLQDPYSTLKGSFIFIAEVPQAIGYRDEVGVFKDGQILWKSGPIIEGALGRIFATMDLTSNGTVDIIATWLAGLSGDREHMWIFSWDGNKGVPVNPYHRQGSRIVGNRGSFLIKDINGDGKYVIICQLDTAAVEYSWNGTTFETITNPPVLANNTFSRANNFSLAVSARAVAASDGFEYDYVASNMPSSAQSVNDIMIAACLDSLREYAPKGWACLAIKNSALARFVVQIGLANILAPGKSLRGFGMVSRCLPAISRFYAQAPHRVPTYEPDQLLAHLSDFADDISNNSVKGFTIGPTAPPLHFSASAWIDTLTSYKQQSLKLGWLIDDKSHKHDCDDIMRDKEWYKKSDFWKHGEWDNDETWDFDHDWDIGLEFTPKSGQGVKPQLIVHFQKPQVICNRVRSGDEPGCRISRDTQKVSFELPPLFENVHGKDVLSSV